MTTRGQDIVAVLKKQIEDTRKAISDLEDEARRANVLELLRRLHDRFDQVILITHIDSVRDALDRLVTVRYDAATGSSVLEGGLIAHDADEELPALWRTSIAPFFDSRPLAGPDAHGGRPSIRQ